MERFDFTKTFLTISFLPNQVTITKDDGDTDELVAKTAAEIVKNKQNIQTTTKVSISKLFTEFLANKEKIGKVSQQSIKKYKSTYNLLLKHYHNLKTIDTFTPQDFSNLQDKLLTTKMNTKTINNHLTYIKMFFEYAEKQDYIQKNPVRVDFLKEQKSTKENFTDDEINTLLTTTKIQQRLS